MRIGVDIDGVLADSLSLWINELNSYFKKNKRVEQIRLLDICETYEVTPQELSGFLARRGRYLMTRPEPITGASQYLGMIKKQHDVYIVTARDERYRQETMDWLSKYNLPYDELLLLGSHEKKEACLSRNLSVLVEDTLEIGVKVSSAGVPVLLLDAPYNQGALPDLIYRAYSWFDVYRTIIVEPHLLNLACTAERRI
ncbi:MAG: 5' nucleotidase, NT5C type [Pelotomaculaceae bacterium]|nr:hypothetical protein [Bacillota bacterium]HHU85417.1 hypothetical protein [Peptococcaceae bacterium]